MKNFNIELNELYYSFKHLKENGCFFQNYEDSSYNGRIVTVNNKKLIHFANCSYLGLETHPDLVEGSIKAVRQYGTQNSMSRAMLSSPLYNELKDCLGLIFPGYQVVFPTTTLSHCSTLPALISEKDAIILDAYVHNSVRMASQLCKANGTFVILSKHNDMDHVRYLVYRLRKEGYRNIWYCADGIYSIHGNLCDVKGLHNLLNEEENFYAYIDDAHGLGWNGKNGCGYVIGNYGLHEKMVVVGSFAKSIASSGGVVIVPEKKLAEFIELTGQTMIFSGPIQPAVLGALVASLRLHLSDQIIDLQNELIDRILYFQSKSKELGLTILTKDTTPIQLLKLGDGNYTLEIQKKLIQNGWFSSYATYPGIARGDEGIRISITRNLNKKDIKTFLEAIKSIISN